MATIKNNIKAINFAANLRMHHHAMTWNEIASMVIKNNHTLYTHNLPERKFVVAQLNKDVLIMHPKLRQNKRKKVVKKVVRRRVAKSKPSVNNEILATITKLKAKGVDADTILITVEALYGN